MQLTRPRVPTTLLIVIAVLLILGYVAGQYINSTMTEEQLAENVFINAIPFVLIFAAIILGFIAIIVVVGSMLNDNVPARPYRIVEQILIGGIVFGVVGMFQPWIFEGYKYGFLVLLISTLGFIVWSHVAPKREQVEEVSAIGPSGEAVQSDNVSTGGGN